ncbi:MAG: HAMP domain-containing histidine kinase [Anaerolineales bacterium]|nr:HAMP domain-containing histidine kinase [Chloroflexota bacterium]MBL6982662.1 HAMP domain-containing histidine kinase [Anaerolineales bacterium]
MRVVDLLDQVRDRWAERVAHRLARGEKVRESFQDQLVRYFDLMRQAITSGDPGWLNEILDEWLEARTQTDQEDQETSLSPILGHILLSLSSVTRELLNSDDALELISAVLPVHNHALQYSSTKEAETYVRHIANDLEEARATLERLDKSKSDFISVAAHELRTPLTLIEGYSSMLQDIYPEDEDARQRVEIMLKGVDNGITRLREIIDDMIDVSLIDNNMLKLNYQPVWLNQLIGIVEQEIRVITEGRSIQLCIEEFPGYKEMIFADSERLYQAIWNILTNAVKYTPDEGKITVSGRTLPGFVEMTVTDTGIGIDPDDQARIFEKFGHLGDISLHSSSKTKFKGGGPGLGLPITKGIIEAHGGTIWVESDGYSEESCPGSTFHVLLPQRKESPDDQVNTIFSPIDDDLDYDEIKETIAKETSWQKK